VADDGGRDAAQEGAPHPAQSAAAHHDESRGELLRDAHDLRVRPPGHGVGPCDLAAHAPYLLYLQVELLASVPFGPLAHRIPEVGVEDRRLWEGIGTGQGLHVDDV
jgi:hypothetical protein